MSEPSAAGISKRELLIFLYKYRLRLFLAFFIPFIATVVISFIPTPRYIANSVLIVRLGSEYVYQPESTSTSGPATAIPFDHDQIFKSEVAILSSDDLHADVIKTIGIEKLFPEMVHPPLIAQIKGYISNTIDDVLIALKLTEKEDMTEEEKQQRLLDQAVQIFDLRFTIVLEKESAVIDMTYENKDRTVARNTLDTLMKLYFEKRKQLFLTPRVELAASELQAKHDRAIAAGKALEKFKREHRIYSLDDQRGELLDQRNALEEQAATIVTSDLQAQIAGYTKQLDDLTKVEEEYADLQRESQAADSAFALYSNKLDEAKSLEELQRDRADSVRIIQSATVPPDPKKLQMLIVLGGFFVSLLSMLAAAAYSEFSRSGFLTPEQIERSLRLPVLGVIPLRKFG